MKGRVISAHGRHFAVKLEDGSVRQSFTKGKKTGVCVGDYVQVSISGHNEARIEEVLPRQNLLYRSDEMRSKQFAANIDQLLIIIAVEPTFSEDLLSRALVGAWSAHITPIIILNKIDLREHYAIAKQKLHTYEVLGVKTIEISTLDPDDLKTKMNVLLQGKTNLLLGQSAMGKSSILNVLVPEAKALTQEHSIVLGTGKHTTTTTRLYDIPELEAYLIDSPGFQSFGLKHLSQQEVVDGFPEFEPYIGQCKFYNCTHQHEPQCAVTKALADGHILEKRYDMYRRILQECTAPERY